jgi:2'-hydroxyisoflavone reductase
VKPPFPATVSSLVIAPIAIVLARLAVNRRAPAELKPRRRCMEMHIMTTSRRAFLQTTAAGLAASASLSSVAFGQSGGMPASDSKSAGKADKPLKILFLGGTGYLGPHTVRHLMARGHEVTLFNRGRTNPHLFPDLEKLEGDRREGELEALEGDRTWDAVIDTSAYYPRVINEAMDILADRIGFYVMISTLSVYADHSQPYKDETAAVGTIEDETVEQVTGLSYGPLKALCEQAAEERLPGKVANLRPGLIVGPGDPTDRWTYWPVRVQQGGEILAPGDGSDPVQIIDVRDLARFMVHCIEQKHAGVMNIVTPPNYLKMNTMLHGCKTAIFNDASFTWVPAEFLVEQGVQAWQHMPAWVPSEGEYAGFGLVKTDRAMKAGLTITPLATTVRDTLDWYDDLPAEEHHRLEADTTYASSETAPEERASMRRAGLSHERETEVLAAWHEHQKDEAEKSEAKEENDSAEQPAEAMGGTS